MDKIAINLSFYISMLVLVLATLGCQKSEIVVSSYSKEVGLGFTATFTEPLDRWIPDGKRSDVHYGLIDSKGSGYISIDFVEKDTFNEDDVEEIISLIGLSLSNYSTVNQQVRDIDSLEIKEINLSNANSEMVTLRINVVNFNSFVAIIHGRASESMEPTTFDNAVDILILSLNLYSP